jgi:hypothetical protein
MSLGRGADVSISSSHFCHSDFVPMTSLYENTEDSWGRGNTYGVSSGGVYEGICRDSFNSFDKSPFISSRKTVLNLFFPSLSQIAPRDLNTKMETSFYTTMKMSKYTRYMKRKTSLQIRG